MAFVSVKDGDHTIYIPEHAIFWMDTCRSNDRSKSDYMTTIVWKDEGETIGEQKFYCLPSFHPSAR